MPTKCAITGTIVAPDGTPIPLAKVTFLTGSGDDAGLVLPATPKTVVPKVVTAVTDEAGVLSISLYPGLYSVRVPQRYGSAHPSFLVTVPVAPFAVLSDIQNLAPPVPLNEAQLAVLAAQAARDEAVAARVGIEEAEGRAAQSATDADASAQAAGASAGAAAGSAGAAGAAAGAAAGSAAAAAADQTQTGQDRAAVAADRSEVETLRSAVAADRTQTAEDRGAAAASAVAALGSENAAAGSAGEAGGSAAAAAASEEAAAQRASEAAADRVQTGQDRTATAADRQQTGADRVATGEDRAATGADRAQTGEDRTATAADRVATGEDRLAAADSAAAALADRIAADAAAIDAQAARDAAMLAAVPLGTEILWRSNVPYPAGWSDTGSRLLSGTSERALLWNFSPLALFSGASAGVSFDPSNLTAIFQDASGSIPAASAGQPVGLTLDESNGLVSGPDRVINGGFGDVATWRTTTSVGAPFLFISGGEARVSIDTSLMIAAPLSAPIPAGSPIKLDLKFRGAGGSIICHVYLAPAGQGYNHANSVKIYDSGLMPAGPDVNVSVYAVSGQVPAYDIIIREQTGVSGRSLYFDNISVREFPGDPARQTVAASRPTLARQPKGGRRNLLTYSEDFTNAVWAKNTGATAPSAKAVSFTADALSRAVQPVSIASADSVTLSFRFQPFDAGKVVRLGLWAAGLDGLAAGNSGNIAIPASGIVSYKWNGVTAVTAVGVINSSAATAQTLTLADDGGAQLELGTVFTPYQKVVSQYDVTEAGVRDCWHLYTDPVDDGLIVTVPAGGWTNATIMVALETGITVLTGQTIPAGAWELPLPRPSKCFGLVAINRELSAMETALLTRYLNLKRGAE